MDGGTDRKYSMINKKKPSRSTTRNCDAFGCKPKGIGGKVKYRGRRRPTPRKPDVQYETDFEFEDVNKSTPGEPTAKAGVDYSEIKGGEDRTIIKDKTWQDVNPADVAAREKELGIKKGLDIEQAKQTATQNLKTGGADERTDAPMSKKGEEYPIKFRNKSEEQRYKFLHGSSEQPKSVSGNRQVTAKRRYRVNPKTGERTLVKSTLYGGKGDTTTEVFHEQNREKITDQSGKVDYRNMPSSTEVVKPGSIPKRSRRRRK